jgi:hypothetical protein
VGQKIGIVKCRIPPLNRPSG